MVKQAVYRADHFGDGPFGQVNLVLHLSGGKLSKHFCPASLQSIVSGC